MPITDALMEQVRDEYDRGKTSIENIRSDFEREDKVFHDQRKDKETITDYSFYVVHSAFMARTYVDKVKAIFQPTQQGIGRDVVDRLNLVYEQDMTEDEWERMNYQKDYDKYKYGVGIVAKVGWDGVKKQNKWKVIDPKMVIPDPDGDYITEDYSFLGFETIMTPEQIPSSWKNTDKLVTNQRPVDEQVLRDAAQRNAGVLTHTDADDIYGIYYHFNYYEGRLCMSVWGNNRTLLLYKTNFDGVFPDEVKNPEEVKISDYVACDRWRPMRESFFGHRLAKFAGNIQEQKALIASLRYKKNKAELYPMYLYNSRLVKNREDLDFGFNKFIAVNALEGEDIGNAMKPVTKDFRSDNSRLMEDDLDEQLTRVTGGMNGDLIQGSDTNRRETLGTNKLIQGNTDINLEHTTRISMWFERQMAKNWLRGYLENFKAGDRKIAQLKTMFGTEYISLKKSDFLKVLDLQIEVESEQIKKQEDQEQRVALTQTFNVIGQMELPTASKMFLLREIAKKSNLKPDQVDIILPLKPQEARAVQENKILADGQFLGIKDDDEHLTHIITHKLSGVENLELQAHIQQHIDAHIATGGKPEEIQGADQNASNLQQSIMGQQLAQQDAVNNGGLGVRT